jgi:ATP-dependent Clp protease adaptor protein ClpS
MSTAIETDELIDERIDQDNSHAIILYNDDENSFDHVIDSLVDICKHEPTQAEQVAWIVHTKGKCDVKHGAFEKLHPLCKGLQSRGLSAVIEH